jgi:hypothetical protein
MKVTYRNAFRDRLAFAAYALPRKPLFVLIVVGTFLLFTFESVIPAVRSSRSHGPVVTAIAFVILELVLALLLAAVYTAVIVIAMVSRMNKPLRCERTVTIGNEGFVTESEYGRSETRWSLVQKLGRTRRHIFLYLSGDSAVMVPRRAFDSTADWDTFYEICRRSTKRV